MEHHRGLLIRPAHAAAEQFKRAIHLLEQLAEALDQAVIEQAIDDAEPARVAIGVPDPGLDHDHVSGAELARLARGQVLGSPHFHIDDFVEDVVVGAHVVGSGGTHHLHSGQTVGIALELGQIQRGNT